MGEDEIGDVLHGEFLPDDVGFGPGLVLGIGHAEDGFAAGDLLGLGLAGVGVLHGAPHGALQDEDPGGPLVHRLDIAAGAPDAHGGGGGADVEALVVLQGRGHVEEDAALHQLDREVFAVLPDLHGALGVLLEEAAVVQVDPGVAVLLGGHPVVVVEAHVFQQGDGFSAALGNGHGSGGFRQPDDRRGLRRQGGTGQAQDQGQCQDQGQEMLFLHNMLPLFMLSKIRARIIPSLYQRGGGKATVISKGGLFFQGGGPYIMATFPYLQRRENVLHYSRLKTA